MSMINWAEQEVQIACKREAPDRKDGEWDYGCACYESAPKYGVIKGITDRGYYTNSFHVPVYYELPAFKKIDIEAPYHALTNAGHISYIELNGDPSKNIAAFESIVRHMKEAGIGYGSINHPVDRDPLCGYNGIIDDVCPCCGRTETVVIKEKIRRIK